MTDERSLEVELADKPSEGEGNLTTRPGKPVFPVVGVGASAGGLEAYQKLLQRVSDQDGLAYVIVQHLDPEHESMLAELLSRRTSLAVKTAEDGDEVEPNHIYLIPPNAEMTIEKRKLRLESFIEPRGRRRPIDTFFKSLARAQGPNAACIVLSGTGADGSEGLRAVKASGGLTVAQDPSGARYGGMPSSAMTTGVVDLVLPAEAMPEAIARYFFRGELPSLDDLSENGTLLETAVKVLRQRTSHDFGSYKHSTLLRRIARRMQVLGIQDEDIYAERLRSDTAEADQLFSDILINVTAFFRDPEIFNRIREDVVPKLFEGKGPEEKVRVWVPGASSGEEAYSLGMLLLEEAANLRHPPRIEIFASDIDPLMLGRARQGVYAASAHKEVPPELADRYLTPDEGGFRVVDRLRDIVRVSQHNLIKDPPFSRLDLISCRNLLIYLDASLQRRLFPMFHYALRSEGYLVLGPSENVPSETGLFSPIGDGQKIYSRRSVRTPHSELIPGPAVQAGFSHSTQAEAAGGSLHRDRAVRETVLSRYVLPHMVVNHKGELLHATNDIGRYLAFPAGGSTIRIEDLAKGGLRSAVIPLIDHLRKNQARRRRVKDVRIENDFDDEALTVDIVGERVADGTFLIVFLESWTTETIAAETTVDTITHDERLRSLQLELSQTEQDLRTTVEELETSNEELKSSNEEMMSMNEELQSANEELTTVNDELQDKIEELARANADKANYLRATQVAAIFLDADYTIRELTPQAESAFEMSQRDIGRNLRAVELPMPPEQVLGLLESVKDANSPIEKEIEAGKNLWYLVRALRYRTLDGEQHGFVLTFTDITDQQRTASRLARAKADYQRQFEEVKEIYRTAPQAMALLDLDRCFIRQNERFSQLTGFSVEHLQGRCIDDVLPELAAIFKEQYAEVLSTSGPIRSVEVLTRTPGHPDEERIFEIDWYPVREAGEVVSVGICLRDVTDRQQLEDDLRRIMRELQHRVKNMLANVTALVSQAQRSSAPAEEKLLVLSKRIRSLAQTHDILTQTDWKETPLTAVIDAELVNVYGAERVSISGPGIKLGARATLALAMAFHELATNASKYGALSVEGGNVEVNWWIFDRGQGATLQLEWKEKGGPAAKEPSKRGFGSSLIISSIEKTLNGRIEREYGPDGFSCVATLPLNELYTERDREHAREGTFKDPFS